MSSTTTTTTITPLSSTSSNPPCCTTPCTLLCTLLSQIHELEFETATEACDMLDDFTSDQLKHLYTLRDDALAQLGTQDLHISAPLVKDAYSNFVERACATPWKAQRRASEESVCSTEGGRERRDSGVAVAFGASRGFLRLL
ncbi:hypothetical protein CLAFUR0_03730 [Fulvia fulva]|nr:hypothetical protein CLAFUR0_03730 [Fulvia fulva]